LESPTGWTAVLRTALAVWAWRPSPCLWQFRFNMTVMSGAPVSRSLFRGAGDWETTVFTA
jgi:hypothetical protein